jgi:hypothetical protein
LLDKNGAESGFIADDRPCMSVTRKVTVSDLHATIYRTLGISPRYGIDVEQRPFYVTKDGLGKAELDVLRG